MLLLLVLVLVLLVELASVLAEVEVVRHIKLGLAHLGLLGLLDHGHWHWNDVGSAVGMMVHRDVLLQAAPWALTLLVLQIRVALDVMSR